MGTQESNGDENGSADAGPKCEVPGYRVNELVRAEGHVYRAVDSELNEPVAIRCIDARISESRALVTSEFRAFARITHPNVVKLYRLLATAERLYVTLELIEGEDILTYVRAPGGPMGPSGADLDRLRTSFVQLASALHAIHAHSLVHRGVRPSNVLVSNAGHVKLLDALTDNVPRRRGSPVYMAPEVVHGDAPSPASDWYAFGVLLCVALTGITPPSELSPTLVTPPSFAGRFTPSLLAPGIPDDLDALCAALLEPYPDDRPSGRDVLERLGMASSMTIASTRVWPPAFVGRTEERRYLERAAQRSRITPVVAWVEGPSGIGKTELVRRTLKDLVDAGWLVLSGRCYERESSSYEALDEPLHRLVTYLRSLPAEIQRSLMGADVAALVRGFPVFGTITGFGRSLDDVSVVAMSDRAIEALKQLLCRIANRQGLVFWVDDLQYGDLEGSRLLARLLRPPGAPRLLFVATHRGDGNSESVQGLVEAIAGHTSPIELVHIELGPLSQHEITRLAWLSVKELPVKVDPGLLAHETHGNPYFLASLLRFLQDHPNAGSGLSIAQMLRVRSAESNTMARRLLEFVCVAAGPVEIQVVLRAAGLIGQALPALYELTVGELVRTVRQERHEYLEAYHDTIRAGVLALMSADAIRAAHLALAEAFERSDHVDPERLAWHFAMGGKLDRARPHAIAAAQRAMQASAYERATALYRSALESAPPVEQRAQLEVCLGDALDASGRGLNAAEAYLQAAVLDAVRAFELRCRAAHVFAMGGELGRADCLWDELLSTDEHDDDAPEPMQQMGSLWIAGKDRLLYSPLAGLELLARASEVARRHARGPDVAIAACIDAMLLACSGKPADPRIRAHIRQARSSLVHPDVQWNEPVVDVVDAALHALTGEWESALRLARASASRLCEPEAKQLDWELDLALSIEVFALQQLGRFAQLAQAARRARQHAGERCTWTSVAVAAEATHWTRLCENDLEGAYASLDALAHVLPSHASTFAHIIHVLGHVHADLYRGDPAGAWKRLVAEHRHFSRYPRFEKSHAIWRTWHARAALATFAYTREPSYRHAAERDARWLVRTKDAGTRVSGHVLLAGLAGCVGASSIVKAALADARALVSETSWITAVLDICAAKSSGISPDGALERLRSRGIVDPGRFVAIFAPGWAG